MKNSVIAIQSFFVITTIVYALLVPVFFIMDNAHGEGGNLVDGSNDKTTYGEQEVVIVETKCKSPCPSTSEEMCITMCA